MWSLVRSRQEGADCFVQKSSMARDGSQIAKQNFDTSFIDEPLTQWFSTSSVPRGGVLGGSSIPLFSSIIFKIINWTVVDIKNWNKASINYKSGGKFWLLEVKHPPLKISGYAPVLNHGVSTNNSKP
jgi:hypothetical protein